MEMDRYGVLVRTDSGRILLIHPITDKEKGIVFFPLRLGYATTLHKVQGATLSDITVWLDQAGWPAAAYVALSRVEYDSQWRIIGQVDTRHFTPADDY